MPLLEIHTSADLPAGERVTPLLQGLSRRVAELLGKPERYVMTCLLPRAAMTMGGATAPSCYVALKSIGTFEPAQTARITAELCPVLERALGVPPDRIYIEFVDGQPHLWGHDGETFA